MGVQKRDPRTFPRFALKKVLACLQHSIVEFFVFRTAVFHVCEFDQKIKVHLRKFLCATYGVLIYMYVYIYTYDLHILSK